MEKERLQSLVEKGAGYARDFHVAYAAEESRRSGSLTALMQQYRAFFIKLKSDLLRKRRQKRILPSRRLIRPKFR